MRRQSIAIFSCLRQGYQTSAIGFAICKNGYLLLLYIRITFCWSSIRDFAGAIFRKLTDTKQATTHDGNTFTSSTRYCFIRAWQSYEKRTCIYTHIHILVHTLALYSLYFLYMWITPSTNVSIRRCIDLSIYRSSGLMIGASIDTIYLFTFIHIVCIENSLSPRWHFMKRWLIPNWNFIESLENSCWLKFIWNIVKILLKLR